MQTLLPHRLPGLEALLFGGNTTRCQLQTLGVDEDSLVHKEVLWWPR